MDAREETVQLYDKWANQNFTDWFNNDALLPSLTDFVSYLPIKPKVLDLGCGTGGESKRVISLGADVIGIDLSTESIKYAKANVGNGTFYVMNILEMTFENACFDGVFEAGVLFHFTENEQIEILNKLKLILKNKGMFLSFYPEGNYEGMEEFKINGEVFRRYARKISKEIWIKTVEGTGFTFIKEMYLNIGTFRPLLFTSI
jgi:2-polyprenyl-3-methyl-5-hydroxy-6-metoxy-1,4-benzoquinol methylase